MKTDDFSLADNLTYIEGYYADVSFLKHILTHEYFDRVHAIKFAEFAPERKFVYVKSPLVERYFLFEIFGDWREFFYKSEDICLVNAGNDILTRAEENK